MYVMGSIEELGNWEEFKCSMTWTKGHIWITKDLRIKSASYFQYKYAVVGPKGLDTIWEQGLIRIADLAILTPIKESKGLGLTSVQLFDEWDYFTVKFGILYPSQSYSQDKRVLAINGGRKELGGWLSAKGPLLMK